jgi:hypothetical protein
MDSQLFANQLQDAGWNWKLALMSKPYSDDLRGGVVM